MYELIISNDQGATETTNHRSKASVRRQIRTWQARDMTAKVYVGSTAVYSGRALSF